MKYKIMTTILIFIFMIQPVSSVMINNFEQVSSSEDNKDMNHNNIFDSKHAVIISGGIGNDLQQHVFSNTGEYAKKVFLKKGYSVDYLYLKSEEEVKDSIRNIHSSKVCIYLIDHGKNGILPSRKGMILNPDWEILTPKELSSLVNTISADTITIVVDTCHAGIFIPALSDNNRVIITSSNHGLSFSHVLNFFGLTFFSKIFLKSLDRGYSYGKAWEIADRKLDNPFNLYNILLLEYPWILANAKIDDNGDGKGSGTFLIDKLDNLEDGDLAKNLYP